VIDVCGVNRQSEHLLLAVMTIFQRKIQDNNPTFFLKFTVARRRIENYLVENKDILSRFVSAVASGSRQERAVDMLNLIINNAIADEEMPTLEAVAATMKLGVSSYYY
jgi:hypothetical protein